MKFLDFLKTNYCEGIYPGCSHWSRTKVRGSKTIRYRPSLSLSTQQIQALLTLFSKFFSSFPQGTCLLPVSSSYLSLHETYHPLCTPFPKSVILKMHTVHEELIMTNRNITLIAALFQEACIQAPIGNAFQHYMSKPKAPIIKMSYVMFIRNYFWYSIWFDFLCLPICLNSAGLQAKLQGQVSRGSQQFTSMFADSAF